jgi:succinate dehydrogenase / fumarate reductase iron-sulfur subunit
MESVMPGNPSRFRIYRYDPDRDAKPRTQDYTVEVTPGMMVLDALRAIKRQDASLSFRHSCREGVCGSDGMNINGRNALACLTPVAELKSPIRINPLPGQPVVRDLVVDQAPFIRQYERARPYLINHDPEPERERHQDPAEQARLDGLYECILCGCCSAACPSFWWNPERFLGPAALLQAARFIEDSRDQDGPQRLAELDDAYRLFRCHTIMNCTEVCPKGLDPSGAIGRLRQRMLGDAL